MGWLLGGCGEEEVRIDMTAAGFSGFLLLGSQESSTPWSLLSTLVPNKVVNGWSLGGKPQEYDQRPTLSQSLAPESHCHSVAGTMTTRDGHLVWASNT